MKTGMEWPLIGIFALLGALLVYNVWSDQQVHLASARVQALAAGESLPVGNALDLTELGLGIVIKVLFGAFFTGIGGVVAYKTWQYIQQRSRERTWRAGPNVNNYQPRLQQPRAPTEKDILLWSLYNNMTAQPRPTLPGPPVRFSKASNDDETVDLFPPD